MKRKFNKGRMTMKKIKKFLAVLTTVTISAVSLCNMVTVNAVIEGRETFRIYMDLPANSGVYMAKFNLLFNPSVTDVCRSRSGNVGSWGWDMLIENNKYKGLKVNFKSPNGDLTTPGIMGSLTMFGPSDVYDLFDVVDIELVTLQNSAKVNLPISRVRFSNVMVGDVNRDGKVNTEDSKLLTKYLNGEITLSANALRASDTTGDFSVTKDDLTYLNDYLNGTVKYLDK